MAIETKRKSKTKKVVKEPKMYKVLLRNDNYTTMEFVVMVLRLIFHKSEAAAQKIMLEVHNNGRGVCGIYPFEIAETKIKQVETAAKQFKFPLSCELEEA